MDKLKSIGCPQLPPRRIIEFCYGYVGFESYTRKRRNRSN